MTSTLLEYLQQFWCCSRKHKLWKGTELTTLRRPQPQSNTTWSRSTSKQSGISVCPTVSTQFYQKNKKKYKPVRKDWKHAIKAQQRHGVSNFSKYVCQRPSMQVDVLNHSALKHTQRAHIMSVFITHIPDWNMCVIYRRRCASSWHKKSHESAADVADNQWNERPDSSVTISCITCIRNLSHTVKAASLLVY